MEGDSLERLEGLIGYRFQDRGILLEALTHSSYVQESPSTIPDNERMEFLGDAILTFLVSVWLAEAFPDYTEGKLSRARARLVAAPHLAAVARRLGLGEFLRFGRGEEKTGGRTKAALLSNALEALVAAVYRDGGLEAARRFVEAALLPADLPTSGDQLCSVDYKSALQQHLQARGLPPGEYRVVEEIGPEHRKTFTVELLAVENLLARGQGPSKKAAEQQAAQFVLEQLQRRGEGNG